MLKKLTTAFKMCFSMFTIFSPSTIDWDDDSRHYMLCFLPFVGLYIGILWKILFNIFNMCIIPKLTLVLPLILAIFPFIASGFIHVDGFMDICDSIACFANKEKRIEILKDPRVGSFSVIYVVLLFIINYLIFLSMNINKVLITIISTKNIFGKDICFTVSCILIFIPIFSRIISCISLNLLKKINVSEYTKVNNNFVLYYALLILLFSSICLFISYKLLIVIFIEMMTSCICFLICNKKYEGVNGDVSGFAITISETVAIFASLLVF